MGREEDQLKKKKKDDERRKWSKSSLVVHNEDMSHSTDRDWEHGVKPRNVVPPPQEELPRCPVRKPTGYCKRLKGEHIFTLVNVKVYPHYTYPGGWRSCEAYVSGVTNYKEYRCDGCNKKKLERDVCEFDQSVKADTLYRGII